MNKVKINKLQELNKEKRTINEKVQKLDDSEKMFAGGVYDNPLINVCQKEKICICKNQQQKNIKIKKNIKKKAITIICHFNGSYGYLSYLHVYIYTKNLIKGEK